MMEMNLTDNCIRDKLIQFNDRLSKLNMDDLSPEDIKIFDELATFCTSNANCSSSLEQMLETDPILKPICENLCRLFALHGFFS